jgi:DNA polymerase sigma
LAQGLVNEQFTLTSSSKIKSLPNISFSADEKISVDISNLVSSGSVTIEIWNYYETTRLASFTTSGKRTISLTSNQNGLRIKLVTSVSSVSVDVSISNENGYEGNCVIRDYVVF